ncbi:unnamed protein product [Protopolystoma xenopodis]|uniref:Uncharacterized protein n=1 Tax=Protopolystoma xenopodis TaxID=117903 RepID=A0A3S5B7Y1_9PLAT|nr:unnamed protein product [Protopolystoma xenopodis]
MDHCDICCETAVEKTVPCIMELSSGRRNRKILLKTDWICSSIARLGVVIIIDHWPRSGAVTLLKDDRDASHWTAMLRFDSDTQSVSLLWSDKPLAHQQERRVLRFKQPVQLIKTEWPKRAKSRLPWLAVLCLLCRIDRLQNFVDTNTRHSSAIFI